MKAYLDIVKHIIDNGEWKENREGPMPDSGNPEYNIVTDIINAVINPKWLSGELREKELSIDAVKGRIRNLTEQKAYL